MNENFNLPQPEDDSAGAHETAGTHETTDASPLTLGLFGAGLALLIAAILPVLSSIYWRFEAAAERSDRSANAAPTTMLPTGASVRTERPRHPLTPVPPISSGPKLQSQPAIDLARLREAENRRLSSYQWIDQQKGVIRIPIERAIAILAERGLPEPRQAVRPTEPEDAKP